MQVDQKVRGALTLEPVEGAAIDLVSIGTTQSLVVGRADHCDVTLPDDAVSRVHATIERRDAGWFVIDHGGVNGTYINGMRIEPGEATPLRHLDVLKIKPWSFITRIDGALNESDPAGEPQPPASQDADGAVRESRSHGSLATRPSIFLRLNTTDTHRREVSWDEFAVRYGPVVIGFARNAGLRRQEADDILQQVLLGFFRVSGNFEYDPAKGRFRGYLKRTTLNAVRAWHRCNHADALLESESRIADPRTADTSWDHEWSKQMLHRALADVKTRFSEQTFEAFNLYGRHGVPAGAVAERLGMSEVSVRKAKVARHERGARANTGVA